MKRNVFCTYGPKVILGVLLSHSSVMISVPCSLFPAPAPAVEVDGIAATVGSESILRSDVCSEMRRAGLTDDSRYSEVLEELIDRKLILKAAADSKMTMQEWVVDNRVREIVGRSFGGDRNKLIEMLGKQRISYPEWYARTKEDLIVGAMRWNVVDKNVVASPEAMRREYDANRAKYAKGRKVSVSVIMLKPEEASRRDEISRALKSGVDFAALGGKRYEDVVPEDLFKPEIVAEIDAMPKGTISRWLEIDGWSFLLRKEGGSAGKTMSFEEAYDEIEAAVREAEAERLYKAWVARLREGAFIRIYR